MLETKQIACGVTTRHVEDIAHMLDLLPSGLWHRAPHPSFVYFPVRSAGNSEMSFDRRRYVEHAHYLHLFLIQCHLRLHWVPQVDGERGRRGCSLCEFRFVPSNLLPGSSGGKQT